MNFFLAYSFIIALNISYIYGNILSPSAVSTSNNKDLFVEANNAFAIRLYKQFTSTSGNIFFCASCLSSSLTLLMEGSKEKTEAEFNETLQFKRTRLQMEEIRSAFDELNQRLRMTECLSQMANAVFVQKEYEPSPEFKNSTTALYNTEILSADFLENPLQAVWDINEFVRAKTQGHIKRLFDRIDVKNKIILINAVHLKTRLENISDRNLTQHDKFYNHDVEDHDVQVLMTESIEARVRVASSYDFRAIELPCGNNNESDMRLWILLPHKVGTLVDVEDGLSTDTFRQLKEDFQEITINVTIPKIKFDFYKDITKDLQKFGLQQAFMPFQGDFSGLSNLKGLYLSQVLQKAMVDIFSENKLEPRSAKSEEDAHYDELDEETESSNIPPFKANHPFLFCVVDTFSGIIVYMGRLFEF